MEGVMISRAQICGLYGMKEAAPMFLLTQGQLGAVDVKDPDGKMRTLSIEGAASHVIHGVTS
jgi:hypothetical protein